MVRVYPGTHDTWFNKERGLIHSTVYGKSYWYRRSRGDRKTIKTYKPSFSERASDKLIICNQIWRNLPPCKKSVYSAISDPSFLAIGKGALPSDTFRDYDIFMNRCMRNFAFIEEVIKNIGCWCIHPVDQARNRMHTSGRLSMMIEPQREFKLSYKQSKSLVDYRASSEGWNSFWGGVAGFNSIKKDIDGVPHFPVKDFSLIAYPAIGVKLPPGKEFWIGANHFTEYIVVWIPISFKRTTYPYDEYPPYDTENIHISSLETAGPDPEDYNGIKYIFTPPEMGFSMCPSNQIEVSVKYNASHVKWEVKSGTKEPTFNVSICGLNVAMAGVGGGKTVVATGVIPRPVTTGYYDIDPETLFPTDKEKWNRFKDARVVSGRVKLVLEDCYIRDGEKRCIEKKYKVTFPEDIYFCGSKKTPQMKVTATTPTKTYGIPEDGPPYAIKNGFVSVYPGYDPFWWYWMLDYHGVALEPGVTEYCIPYTGYWCGPLRELTVRYAVTRSPFWEYRHVGGGLLGIDVLVFE